MKDIKTREDFRGEMVELLKRDFFGPYNGIDETIAYKDEDDTPMHRYSTGILFPPEMPTSREDDEDVENEFGESGESEGKLAQSNVRRPSCYGITFTCSEDAKSIMLEVNAGCYEQTPAEDKDVDLQWKRKSITPSWVERTGSSKLELPVIRENTEKSVKVCDGLEAYIKYREPSEEGQVSITISLINKNEVKPLEDEDDSRRSRRRFVPFKDIAENSFYQVHFSVSGKDGQRIFTERPFDGRQEVGDENKAFYILYRHQKNFATGHGCSAKWDDPEDDQCSRIESCFIPEYDIYPLTPPKDLNLPRFLLSEIATASLDDLKGLFGTITTIYENWIIERSKEIENISVSKDKEINDNFIAVAQEQQKSCLLALQRIKKGINALGDPLILRAFQLAHKAMLIVFALSDWKKRQYNGKPDYNSDHKWYPFQIAFILLCLESVGNNSSDDRLIADLLWFPTGGGKTEAYLGLTAFVLFLRRLRGKDEHHRGGGTAVITRYTLRLLTADQFERSAAMICACEKVRREELDIQNTAPISIGLWIGGGGTPNKINIDNNYEKGYQQLIRQYQESLPESGTPNPVVLTRCPYCGTEISAADYDSNQPRARCPDESCCFHDELPVHFVDEDIYEVRPSLIIGTIDKFARLPWEENSGNFFGTDGQTPPPDLIIQDELHLISGPLGTLAGLYETAIDLLSAQNSHRPKIIASTATIKNAESQVRALFDRQFAQFPPPFLDARDSFFAREDRAKPARKYVGIFTPGKTGTTTFIRSTASLLHSAKKLKANDEIRDPYWTFMGYFNSLRELGSARVQVMDDINDYMRFCAERDNERKRDIEEVFELTSRGNESRLKEIRKRLWSQYSDDDVLEVVLATNMISVGLDVPRLGLMSVIGQPKTTAEYIQATSRVGRLYPGLVVTLYNHMRSRDRSHYERFQFYHSRLYAEVEATSVTPFSVGARERGLHAILVTLVRHLLDNMKENSEASNFDRSKVVDIKEEILSRAKNIDSIETDAVAEMLDSIIDTWDDMKNREPTIYYDYARVEKNRSLLLRFEEKDAELYRGFRTLNNLRNVDATVNLYLD